MASENKKPSSQSKKNKKRKRGRKIIESRPLIDSSEKKSTVNVEIEYQPEKIPDIGSGLDEQSAIEFNKVFEKFAFTEPSNDKDTENEPEIAVKPVEFHPDGDQSSSEEEDDAEEYDEEAERQHEISMKKLRKMQRMSVAELKSRVKNPEVVEWFDVSAKDPLFLVYLKAYRNSVPVPVHWSLKRKYLSAKRGIERPPFELPDFIKDTGIIQMREAVKEKEDSQKLKSQMRAKTQPKMGKIIVDYQRLHEAFFEHQTKPNMTVHGDLYYEGKEFETKVKEKRPGILSPELKEALGMTHPTLPPPWLINMQRFGPPPSYPNMKIPGLNAPIPEGAQWGYHPGGWGKPPVDEYNRPLYGDVFGVGQYQPAA